MRADGATYRNAHVVDSLCCPSRAAIFTGRPPHQTGVLTNTPNDPVHPIGGYRCVHPQRQTRQVVQRRAAEGRLHDRVRRQVHERLRDVHQLRGKHFAPAKVPGWDVLRRGPQWRLPEWGFRSTYLDQNGGVPDAAHPRGRTQRLGARARQGLRHQRHVADHAEQFLREQRDPKKPYFLEVATYGPHAQMQKAYPDNPPFPSAFADRAPKGHPAGGNCGTKPVRPADAPATSRGTPTRGTTTRRPTCGATAPPRLLRRGTSTRSRSATRWALQQYRDRARMVQSIDRMLGRLRAEARREHLLLPDFRQRLPPRPAPAQRRQGHAVRLRHARARSWSTGPGCAAGHAQAVRQQHRPGADLRDARRPASAEVLPLGDRRSPTACDDPRAPGWPVRVHASTPTPSSTRRRGGQRHARSGGDIQSDPVVHRGAGQARAAGALRPRQLLRAAPTTPGSSTATTCRGRTATSSRPDHDKPWARELMRRLRDVGRLRAGRSAEHSAADSASLSLRSGAGVHAGGMAWRKALVVTATLGALILVATAIHFAVARGASRASGGKHLAPRTGGLRQTPVHGDGADGRRRPMSCSPPCRKARGWSPEGRRTATRTSSTRCAAPRAPRSSPVARPTRPAC